MEKLSAIFIYSSYLTGQGVARSGFPFEGYKSDKKLETDRWNVFVTRDRLFHIYEGTVDIRQNHGGSSSQNIEILNRKSQAVLDLGKLDYGTRRKEESLRSWAHYKIGLTKLLHTYDIHYSKFHRDLMRDVLAMNKASNLSYSSPKNLMDSMRYTMGSMKQFVEMLRPMAHVMRKMNEINQSIVKIGHEIGPEGANKVFKELSEEIESYPGLAGGVSQIGRSSEKPSDELSVGKFYQDWTADCLLQGIETLNYANSQIRKHTNKLKTLSLLSRTANRIKAQKKDPRSFTLPATLAVEAYDKERSEKRNLDEMEQGLSQFADVNRLEMEVPEIMNNELLKDPYFLASEAIAQGSLNKDITGIDETSRVTTQTHGAMFS